MPRRVLGLRSETRLHKVRDGFSKPCGVCECVLRVWSVHDSMLVFCSGCVELEPISRCLLPTLSLLQPACERSPACNDSGREVSSLRGRVGQLEASLETAKADAARTLATLQARCVTDVNIDAHSFALTFHAACTCVSWNGTPTFRCA